MWSDVGRVKYSEHISINIPNMKFALLDAFIELISKINKLSFLYLNHGVIGKKVQSPGLFGIFGAKIVHFLFFKLCKNLNNKYFDYLKFYIELILI